MNDSKFTQEAKKKGPIEGVCHVCGISGPLSFEHIPPKSTGNNTLSKVYSGIDYLQRYGNETFPSDIKMHYTQHQRGSGVYAFCSHCNNYFGSHYVKAYTDAHLATCEWFNANPPVNDFAGGIFQTDQMHVLAFIKHIITIFCATTQCGSMFDCREFLLDYKSNYLPTKYRLVMYALPDKKIKQYTTGWTKQLVGDISNPSIITVAHFRTHPFGFSLYDLEQTTTLLSYMGCNITDFSKFKWGETPNITLPLAYHKGDNPLPI